MDYSEIKINMTVLYNKKIFNVIRKNGTTHSICIVDEKDQHYVLNKNQQINLIEYPNLIYKINMEKELVKKGYTLEVTSWENDADNYRTESITYENKDEATRISKMIRELFCSSTNGGKGIGNIMDEDEKAEQIILEYLSENIVFEDQENMDDETKVDNVMGINNDVMGGSEWYYSRVFDSMEIYYSHESININLIDL